VLQGAGHFVFMTPCSADEDAETPELCEDAIGVDRQAIHPSLNGEAALLRQPVARQSAAGFLALSARRAAGNRKSWRALCKEVPGRRRPRGEIRAGA
jgi:hypothetical protein